MKILIVDHDPVSLMLAETTLSADGHDVVTCERGGQALGAGLREEFDVVVCEYELPDINGLEVVRAIKMQSPGLAVVVVSATDAGSWRIEATEAGAGAFVEKPIKPDRLRAAVARVSGGVDLDVIVAATDYVAIDIVGSAFKTAGANLRLAASSAAVLVQLAERSPQLVIIEAALRDSHVVIAVCGRRRIACFVLADAGFDEEAALLDGVAYVAFAPVDGEQMLERARFIAAA